MIIFFIDKYVIKLHDYNKSFTQMVSLSGLSITLFFKLRKVCPQIGLANTQ